MAEVTALRTNALPYPVYGVPYGLTFPIFKSDSSLISAAAGLDSERSLNGDTFADCTNEATEIATSTGIYYLLLTAAEMTADEVAVQVKSSTTGAVTQVISLQPAKLVSLRANTAQAGAAGTITLDAGASAVDGFFNGCLIVTTGGTGSGQARVCSGYVGSTKVASVAVNWATNPDNTTTFAVYVPWGRQFADSNALAFGGVAGTFASGRPEVNATHWAGTATTLTAGLPDVNTKTITNGIIAAATFAANALDAVWSTAARVLTAGTNIVLAKGVGVTGFNDLDAAGVRGAVGLGSANLDTQLGAIAGFVDTEIGTLQTTANAINAKTTNLPASPAATSDIPTANQNADALLDRAAGIETNRTLRQGLRLMLAAIAGKASGLATVTATYRDTNDLKDRIVATVDADGNRTAVTLDAS